MTNRGRLLASVAAPLLLGTFGLGSAHAYDWSGFYAGFGLSSLHTNDGGTLIWEDPDNDIGTGDWMRGNVYNLHDRTIFEGGSLSDFPAKLDNASFELKAGYDQEIDQFLYGIEAGFTAGAGVSTATYTSIVNAEFSNDEDPFYTTFAEEVSGRASIDWLSTFEGKVGLTLDRTLLYATAGLAFGHVSQSTSASIDYESFLVTFQPTWAGSNSEVRIGTAIGAGVDQAIDDHWIVGASAEYFNLGEAKYDVVSDDGLATIGHQTQKFDGYKLSVGLRYKF